MADRIVDQVHRQALQEPRVAVGAGRVKGGVQSQPATLDLIVAVGERLADQRGQVHGLATFETTLAAGQAEERVDQLLELLL